MQRVTDKFPDLQDGEGEWIVTEHVHDCGKPIMLFERSIGDRWRCGVCETIWIVIVSPNDGRSKVLVREE